MSIVPQLIVNSLFVGALYALLAMSFNLIFGTTKFFNFAHSSYALIAGYAVFYLVAGRGLPMYLAAIIGLLAAGTSGYLLDKAVYLPLRKNKSTSTVKLVASIGIFTVIQGLLAITFSSQFQTLSNTLGEEKIYSMPFAVFTQTQLVSFISAIFVFMGLLALLKFTMFGKAVKAISDDEEVAKIVGINTNKIISYVFFIGAAISGWVGILAVYDTGIEPTLGLNLFFKAVIAAIIGGLGSIEGAFLGAFLLGFAENFGIWKINGEWKNAIVSGVLIIFLLFRPQGIFKK